MGLVNIAKNITVVHNANGNEFNFNNNQHKGFFSRLCTTLFGKSEAQVDAIQQSESIETEESRFTVKVNKGGMLNGRFANQSDAIQGPRYITDERKSRYILTKEQDQDAEFEFFTDKFYIMTFYYITLHDGKDYYVLLDHGSYSPNPTHINDFWSIPRSVTIINGPKIKTVEGILTMYDEELEKSSMKEKLDMQETDFFYNYGLFNRKKEIVSCHVEYKRSVTEPEKMRCYYIRNIFVSRIDPVGIRNLVDPECRHNHTFLPLSIINNLPRINGSGDEAPEHGWYSFMGRPIPENIMDVFIKERENLINKSVKIKESDLFRHSQGVLFHVAISNAHEFFMSSADRSIIDRQIAGIYEEVMMRHNIMHHAVDHYQVIGAIRADGGVDFTQLLEEMFEKFSRLVYRRHTYLLLRCTVIFGQYEFGKTYGLCSSIPGFSGKAYERLKIMAHQTHNVQMEFGYEMNGILFGYSLDDSDNVKFDPLGVQKCSQGRNISYGMRFLIKKYL